MPDLFFTQRAIKVMECRADMRKRQKREIYETAPGPQQMYSSKQPDVIILDEPTHRGLTHSGVKEFFAAGQYSGSRDS